MHHCRCYTVLGVLALLVLASSLAGAATLQVPANYGTIQAAIDAAAAGDTVVVAAGTYVEQLDFKGKAITVISTAPTDDAVVAATIISCPTASPIVSFVTGETATSILEGFTITDGDANLASEAGGAILCDGASPTIRNNVITANGAEARGSGGGIACLSAAAPQILNNVFSDNSAGFGGAIYIYDDSPTTPLAPGPTISGNTFYGNAAYQGGAIYCWSAQFTASNNAFGVSTASTNPLLATAAAALKAKVASKPAASKAAPGSKPTKLAAPAPAPRQPVSRSFSPAAVAHARELAAYGGNGASYGGALYLYYASATLTGNTFRNNAAGNYGGAIDVCYGGPVDLSDNVFERNVTYAGYGSGVYAEGWTASQPTLTFDGDRFSHNVGGYGGGVYLADANGSFTDCVFTGNTTDSEGAGVCCYSTIATALSFTDCAFSDNGGEYGGAAYLSGSTSPLTVAMDGCSFDRNVAGDGYAGAVYFGGCTATVDDCSFTGNCTDYYGGALYVSEALLHLTDSSFTSNQVVYSDGYGGAIDFYGAGSDPATIPAVGSARDNISYIESCTFTDNRCAYYGGALYASSGYLEVRDCNFLRNTNGYYGGAVYWASGAGCCFERNVFEGNTTGFYGGAVYLNGGGESANLWRNNTFTGNTASGVWASGVSGGDGGAVCTASGCTFTGNLFLSNRAAARGGAFYADAGYSQTISNNTLVGNSALQGGGLCISGGSGINCRNNIVAFSPKGSGIYTTDGSQCTYNDVYGNKNSQWRGVPDQTGSNGNLSVDPLFVSRSTGDYRLRSVGGHYDDATSAWVQDTMTSRCIDAGDPGDSYALEAAPNARRINLGYDGGTATASKSSMFAQIGLRQGVNGVSRTEPVTFVFLSNMTQSSVDATFGQTGGSSSAITLDWVTPRKATFTPDTLNAGAAYQFVFPTSSRRQDGTFVTWAETINLVAGKEPVVTDTTPDEAGRVAVGAPVVVTFDQQMYKNPTQGAFLLAPEWGSGTPVPVSGSFSWSSDARTMTFTPAAALTGSTTYVCRVGKAARGVNGVLPKPHSFTFETDASSAPPAVLTAAAAPAANGSVTLTVNLAAAATVTGRVLNVAGVPVAALPATGLAAGVSTLTWNGKSGSGTTVPGGRYLISLTASSAGGTQYSGLVPLSR